MTVYVHGQETLLKYFLDKGYKMKTVYIGIFFSVFIISNIFASSGGLLLGIDMRGTHTASINGHSQSTDVKLGLSGMMEMYSHFSMNVDMGVGLEFMLPHELETSGSDPAFQFMPLYFSTFLHGSRNNDFVPYMGFQLGYNLLYLGNNDYSGSADLKGGLYMGLMLGTVIDREYRVEIRWAEYLGDVDNSAIDDVSYNEISLVFGKIF